MSDKKQDISKIISDSVEPSWKTLSPPDHVPFLFPKGMKHDPSLDGGTRNSEKVVSNGYYYEDETNGITRSFFAREVRYAGMDDDGIDPDLRIVFIDYTYGFEFIRKEYLLSIHTFRSLINR
jgi:hypothetical protein